MSVIRGSSFYITVNGQTWSTAESNAINLGGNLVSVNDESESTWLGNEFSQTKYQYAGDNIGPASEWTINHYWTGATKNSSGNWEWSSGENFDTSLSSLLINNNDSNHNKFLAIFNNPNHSNPYIYLDDMHNNSSGSFGVLKGIAEIPLSYFSISDLTITEGNSGNVTISRTGGTNTAQTFSLVSSNGTANAGSDYTAINQTISFVAGESSKTVAISSIENTNAESSETFSLSLTASNSDTVPAQITDGTATVTIQDDDKEYNLSTSSSSINEGSTLTTSISTTNVDAGTTLYWSVSGTGINSDDFSSGALTGSGTVGSDGSLSFSHTLANDLTTEGSETLNIKLFSDSSRSTQVGSTSSVSIGDTSKTLSPAYTINPSSTSINEGSTLTTSISTTNVDAGTNLYWSLSGNVITNDDFSSGALTGSGTVGSDGSLSFSHTLANDLTTEGSETLNIKLFSDSSRSTQVGSTSSVSIGDTSKTPSSDFDGTDKDDSFISGPSNDSINGGSGIDKVIYSGKFSDYSFTRISTTLEIEDERTGTNDGTDTLSSIEYIQFSDQTVEESKVDIIKTYSGMFSDYKFYNKGNGKYEIKTNSGYDDITGLPLLTFTGEATTSSFRDTSAIVDIKGTFDQVTGLNTDDAKMFRLYNAAFKRLPDADGLKYWIGKYTSGENDEREVAQSFLVSDEFKERYGANVSNAKYVETLYTNVLGRDYDQEGYNYWLGNLNSGLETRYELLLGFAESAENITLFTEMTGFG